MTTALNLAAVLTIAAAIAHFACIPIGAPAYKFMGAGDRIVRAVQRGNKRPHLIAFVIGSILLMVAVFAFSTSGVLPALPLQRWVLGAVALVLLARALLFPLLRSRFPGNSPAFWWLSSAVCLVLGLLYLTGVLHTAAQG